MIEDELRAAFARHESLTPAAGPVRSAIDRTAQRRRRRRLVAQAAGAVLAVLLVVGAAPLLARTQGTDPSPPLAGIVAPPTDGTQTFLVLGIDAQRQADRPVALVDTLLIVHVPRQRDRTYVISVPRDAALPIPGRGTNRINAAYHLGGGGSTGIALTRQALSDATGLRFDGVLALDYGAVRRITDELGGVRLCLDAPVRSVHTRRSYPAGCARFTGEQAVDLLRQRYGMPNGAYDRDRNGRRFVQALVQRADDLGVGHNPVRVDRLVRAAGRGLTVDLAGLSVADLLRSAIGLAGAPVIGIGASRFAPEPAGDRTYEQLYPGVREHLFAAVRDDRLPQWLAAHPGYADR